MKILIVHACFKPEFEQALLLPGSENDWFGASF